MVDIWQKPVGIPVVKSGWICPKCGKVYSPDWPECSPCNNTQPKQPAQGAKDE